MVIFVKLLLLLLPHIQVFEQPWPWVEIFIVSTKVGEFVHNETS